MNRVLQRIHDIGVVAWVRLVQALNWIMLTLASSALLIHQTYPDLVRATIGKMPPVVGVVAIIIFCGVVHYALRRAAKSAS